MIKSCWVEWHAIRGWQFEQSAKSIPTWAEPFNSQYRLWLCCFRKSLSLYERPFNALMIIPLAVNVPYIYYFTHRLNHKPRIRSVNMQICGYTVGSGSLRVRTAALSTHSQLGARQDTTDLLQNMERVEKQDVFPLTETIPMRRLIGWKMKEKACSPFHPVC